MLRFIEKVVIFILIFTLSFGPVICQVRAEGMEGTATTSEQEAERKEEGEKPGEDKTEVAKEAAGPEEMTTEAENTDAEEVTTEAEEEQAKEQTTEVREDLEEKDTASEKETVKEETTGQAEPGPVEGPDQDEEETEKIVHKPKMALRSIGSDINHNVTMPDVTSLYFTRQKEGKNVASASGPKLKVVSGSKEAETYIFREYPQGTRYNFTPMMGPDTRITVGGGEGGTISLSTVSSGTYKEYGAVQEAAQEGSAEKCAFNLDKCKTNPYAIYTNVGSWYDQDTGKTYPIDMKLTITGYLYPSQAIRSQLENQKMTGPYASFRNDIIGVDSMATDNLSMRLDFYYAGTTTPVEGIRGIIQFCDIDSQQGVDYGKGFEQVILFNTGNSRIAYNPKGVLDPGVGYAYSEVNQNLKSADMNTTVAGLFSGSSVTCSWTLSRCDQKDTGGNARYRDPAGYGIPRGSDEIEAKCYYEQSSTGMMAIRADVGLAPLPGEISKQVYAGKINKSPGKDADSTLSLKNREEECTFVLDTNVPEPSNFRKARYTSFSLEDRIDPLMEVGQVAVYSGTAKEEAAQENVKDVTGLFTVSRQEEADGGTKVLLTATNAALANQEFYGRSYHVHIQTRVRTDEELARWGHHITDWIQKDDHMGQETGLDMHTEGVYCTDNDGILRVSNTSSMTMEETSNKVIVMLPRQIRILKLDGMTGHPVEGVEFGLFGGSGSDDPICTAKTDKNGIATFTETRTCPFYRKAFGDGPYLIREISVPDAYKNVWDKRVIDSWTRKIPSLKELKPAEKGDEDEDPSGDSVLTNENNESSPESILVRKKNTETGADLEGAVFALMEWSVEADQYVEKMELVPGKDEKNRPIYYNDQEFSNTMDNLGRYKIVEKEAPRGCVLTGEEWTFELDQDAADDPGKIIYRNGKKTCTGELTYSNPIQKGVLDIHKTDDDGEEVEGAVFLVTAAEDIYAPWQLDDKGQPKKGEIPLVKEGEAVDEIRTDAKGFGSSTKGAELYIGSYHVTETVGAKDHVKGNQVYDVTFQYGTDQSRALVTYTLEANNKKMRPSFVVAKLADKTTNPDKKEVLFDKITGRYIQKKVAGIYDSKEKADYTITITNTGNTPLKHLLVTDDMTKDHEGHCLAEYVEEAYFLSTPNGKLTSQSGKEIRTSWPSENRTSILLSDLEVGDSVVLHYMITLNGKGANVYALENDVYVQAKYNDNEKDPDENHYVPVDTENMKDADGNSLAEDADWIHIPGKTGLDPLKLADRTKGIEIRNGQIQEGNKVPGIYREGEKVTYKIYVRNTGTARLHTIRVKDEMSSELVSVTDQAHTGFVVDPKGNGKVTTKQGKTISIKKNSPTELILAGSGAADDFLQPGDYVVLTFRAVILHNAANFYDLENTAVVNAYYFDGNTDQPVGEEEDKDKIEIPGTAETVVAKLADRTRGVILKEGRYEPEARISGSYKNGENVTYKITVSNRGTACLYQMALEDRMSEELKRALDMDSVHFKEGEYRSVSKKTVRAKTGKDGKLYLDFLAPGDSVVITLHARVKEDAGNLFALRNDVILTANARTGNEEEEQVQTKEAGQVHVLRYHSGLTEDEIYEDSETPCRPTKKIHVDGNPFVNRGYLFNGWNTAADGSGNSILPDDTLTLKEGDLDLYARWIPMSDQTNLYLLIYDANDGSGRRAGDDENARPEDAVIKIDEDVFQRDGYTLAGWNSRPSGDGADYSPGDSLTMPGHNQVVYAVWSKDKTCALTYHSNDGQDMARKDAQTPCACGTEVTIEGNTWSRTGKGTEYHFAGWNSRPDGSGESFQAGDTMDLTADADLYAIWEESGDKDYHVVYHANNKTTRIAGGKQSPSPAGETILTEENMFSHTGYEFTGWTVSPGSDDLIQPGEEMVMPDHDLHLYANWTEVSPVKIRYHSNSPQEETVESEEPVISGSLFVNGARTFAGWNTAADGSGTSYPPKDRYSMEKDLDLYALWEDTASSVLLIYDSGDGRREVDSETPALSDVRVAINPNRFEREGYAFTGWNSKKDGSGTDYQPGSLLRMPQEDTVLYAIWEEKAEETAREEETPEGPQEELSVGSVGKVGTEAVEKAYRQIQGMSLDKALETGKGYKPVKETDLMKDHDAINVPGSPDLVAAKLADRTRGASLQEGRYRGTKEEGCYSPGEKVDYTITVTNRGTADVTDLLVTDTMESDLLACVSKKSIKITTGDIRTTKGNSARVVEEDSGKSTKAVRISGLKAGDSVVLHLTAVVLGSVLENAGLKNTVKVTGKYMDVGDDGRKEETPVPETDRMKDQDTIGTGAPALLIAKKADRTSGVTLKEGRYSGTRKQGVYEKGQVISFQLTVTNTGTAPAYHVKVTETPAERLLTYASVAGFQAGKGASLKTVKGNSVRVVSVTKRQLTLDQLAAGDQVTLLWTMKVKEKVSRVQGLKNTVSVEGKAGDGSRITPTAGMKDSDKLSLKKGSGEDGSKKQKSSKNSSKGNSLRSGTPKTGDDNRILPLLLAFALSAAGLGIMGRRIRRSR